MDTDPSSELQFRRNRFGERYLHAIDRALFETEPSGEVLARRLACDFGAEDRLFVVVGSDSGLLAAHLLEPGRLGRGSRAVLVEADDVHPLVRDRVPEGPDARVTLCRAGDWDRTVETLQIDRYVYGGAIEVVESLGCVHDHDGRYVPVLRAVKAGIARAAQDFKSSVDGKFFTLAQLANACDNVRPASALRGVGAGRTALVLGAGPSLDDAIDWIRTERARLFVIAVSRLAGKLQGLGIRPDAVVSVDPQDVLYDISREGLLWDDVPLFGAYHVAPQLLQQWRGPRYYLGELLPWRAADDPSRDNVACAGPTVSHAGAWLAGELGFERIYLCGVDLCYAIGGNSHARGGAAGLVGFLPSQCDASVTTYAGRLAGTSIQLRQGVDHLERIGRRVNAERPRMFNLAPDAARVDGIPHVPIADVELADVAPVSLPAEDTAPRPAHLERLLDEFARARRHFGAVGRRCDEAVRLIRAMDDARDAAAGAAQWRKLERLRRRLDREHGEWVEILKRYASAELLRTLRPDGLEDVEDAERRRWGRHYFRTLSRGTTLFGELLGRAEERARRRLAELDATPDVDALLAYWASDRTPGRALMLHGRTAADGATDERLRTAADAFVAGLRRDDEGDHPEKLYRDALGPRNVLRNLAFLFAERSADDLHALAAGLRTVASPTDTLGDYAAGLAAELDGDVALALEHHGRVVDRFGGWLESEAGPPEGFDPLLESVLVRVAGCQLRTADGPAAAETLALLAGLSAAYAPRQARLLHLLGEHARALAVLEEHVRAQPDDWRALSQMADVYASMGADDAAAMARGLARDVRDGARPVDAAA